MEKWEEMSSVLKGEKQIQMHVYMMHMYVEIERLPIALFYPYIYIMYIWQAAIPNGTSSFNRNQGHQKYALNLCYPSTWSIKKPSSERFNLHSAN